MNLPALEKNGVFCHGAGEANASATSPANPFRLRFFVLAVCLLASCMSLAGCGTSAPGATWWNPATWWSASEAHAADRAVEAVAEQQDETDEARDALLRSGQREAHKSSEALAAAIIALPPVTQPDPLATSRAALDLSRRFSGNAIRSLDQALGALPASDAAMDSRLVLDMGSLDPARRAEAARLQAAAEEALAAKGRAWAAAEDALAAAREALEAKTADLRAAFERENALANTLRNQRMALYGLAGLSVILAAAWAYLRIASGGVIKAIGTTLADLKGSDASTYRAAVAALDANLDRSEQAAIRRAKVAALITPGTLPL